MAMGGLSEAIRLRRLNRLELVRTFFTQRLDQIEDNIYALSEQGEESGLEEESGLKNASTFYGIVEDADREAVLQRKAEARSRQAQRLSIDRRGRAADVEAGKDRQDDGEQDRSRQRQPQEREAQQKDQSEDREQDQGRPQARDRTGHPDEEAGPGTKAGQQPGEGRKK